MEETLTNSRGGLDIDARLEMPEVSLTSPIDKITGLRIGDSYTISEAGMKMGKLVDVNLFGYRFECPDTEGNLSFTEMGFDEIELHVGEGHVKKLR